MHGYLDGIGSLLTDKRQRAPQVSDPRGRGAMAVVVAVFVDVSAPVMVAALVNGSDTVGVIDARLAADC